MKQTNKYSEKADSLWGEIIELMQRKIQSSKKESKVNGNNYIKIPDSFDCGVHVFIEAQETCIVEEYGYIYEYNIFSLDKLAKLADLIKACPIGKSNKNSNRVDLLRNELLTLIKQKIGSSKKYSKVNGEGFIKIPDDFDSDTPNIFLEAQENQLIDVRGLYFNYDVLSTDVLAELADLINA